MRLRKPKFYEVLAVSAGMVAATVGGVACSSEVQGQPASVPASASATPAQEAPASGSHGSHELPALEYNLTVLDSAISDLMSNEAATPLPNVYGTVQEGIETGVQFNQLGGGTITFSERRTTMDNPDTLNLMRVEQTAPGSTKSFKVLLEGKPGAPFGNWNATCSDDSGANVRVVEGEQIIYGSTGQIVNDPGKAQTFLNNMTLALQEAAGTTMALPESGPPITGPDGANFCARFAPPRQ